LIFVFIEFVVFAFDDFIVGFGFDGIFYVSVVCVVDGSLWGVFI